MRKKYILKQEQYDRLIESKKNEKKIFESIMSEINRIKKGLNESTMRKNAVSDVIKKYHKKGNLTPYIKQKLEKNGITFK